jgi:hypothetical protein
MSGSTLRGEDGMTSTFSTVLTKLKARHIIETLAAFIGGGWLLLEFVH